MNPNLRIPPSGMIRDAITSHRDRCLAALLARTYQSWKLALDGSQLVGTGPGTAAVNLFLQQGRGATVTDLDGRTMIDLSMGAGAALLGHDPPGIRDALHAQIADGWHLGLATSLQVEIARLIQKAGPANERIALCIDGSDATHLAIRAARVVTGKEGLGIFTGSHHGQHSYGVTASEPRPGDKAVRNLHQGGGIAQATSESLSVLPYGHPAAFDLIRRHRHELAAIVVEAVRACEPHLDAGPWLRDLANVCRRDGVLLILDEITTGFRLAYGGAQEVFDVAPDMVVYGKAVGGGLPLGAVAGRTAVMRPFGQDQSAQGIVSVGAFAGNTLSVAAGTAFLTHAYEQRDVLYPALERSTARLAAAYNAAAARLGVPATMYHAGSIFMICLGPAKPRRSEPGLLRTAMDAMVVGALNGGVMLRSDLTGYISAAHTDEQIDQAAAVLTATLSDIKADGLFSALAAH